MTWWVEYKKLICFVVVLISSSIAAKLIFGNISVDLGAVSMFDMLSISIAFFAIGISFAFYFQASNTSNQFYDNTYKFTNEVSEILGRIEGAFGEKLSHLDDSYSRMDKKLDRNFNPRAAEEKLEENEDEKESSLEEQKKLIDDLVARSEMTEADRDSFYEKWKETQERLMHATEEISALQGKLNRYRSDVHEGVFSVADIDAFSLNELTIILQNVLRKRIHREPAVVQDLAHGGRSFMNMWYNNEFPPSGRFRRTMRQLGFETANGLTEKGIEFIKEHAKRLRKEGFG